MNLGDMVIPRTVEGDHEGRIVGRTLEGNAKYDVRTPTGIIFINVPAKYVQLATPTAKPTPPAAPQTTNVSQPSREQNYAPAKTTEQAQTVHP